MLVYLDADYARKTAHHIRMKLLKDLLYEAECTNQTYSHLLDTICFEVKKKPKDIPDKGIIWKVLNGNKN